MPCARSCVLDWAWRRGGRPKGNVRRSAVPRRSFFHLPFKVCIQVGWADAWGVSMVWTDSLTHCAAASSILARSRYREIGVDGQRSVNWVRTRNSPSAGRSRERPASILAPDMIQSSVGQAVQNTTGEAFVRMPRLHFYRSATPTSQTGARDEWTKQPRANARHSIAEARRTDALATRRSIARHRGKSPNARSSARFASNCSIMPLEPPKSDIHSIASAIGGAFVKNAPLSFMLSSWRGRRRSLRIRAVRLGLDGGLPPLPAFARRRCVRACRRCAR